MSEYPFVYGTLLPGHVPRKVAPVAAKLRLVGEGHVRGRLYDLGGYPGAVPDSSSEQRISGTVMQLPDEEKVLRQLDAYEGFDPRSPGTSEYIRVPQRVDMATSGSIECWFYRYNWVPDTSRIIESGKWKI